MNRTVSDVLNCSGDRVLSCLETVGRKDSDFEEVKLETGAKANTK